MKILFASLAAEGHFNPLTGIAVHLRDAGHDVRWYTGASMAAKLGKLGIPLLPFRRATEITGENLPTLFPERAKLRGIKQIRFDGEKIMFVNVDAYYQDVKQIHQDFPFDLLFCDGAFYGARLIKEKLGKPVFALHAGPESMEDAPNLPPMFLGLQAGQDGDRPNVLPNSEGRRRSDGQSAVADHLQPGARRPRRRTHRAGRFSTRPCARRTCPSSMGCRGWPIPANEKTRPWSSPAPAIPGVIRRGAADNSPPNWGNSPHRARLPGHRRQRRSGQADDSGAGRAARHRLSGRRRDRRSPNR